MSCHLTTCSNWTLDKARSPIKCSGNITLSYPESIEANINIIPYLGVKEIASGIFKTGTNIIWFQNSLNIRAIPVYGNAVVTSIPTGGLIGIPTATINLTSGNLIATGNFPCCTCQQPIIITPSIMLNGILVNQPEPTNAILTKRGGTAYSTFLVGNSALPNQYESLTLKYQYHFKCINSEVIANIYRIDLLTTGNPQRSN